MLNPAHDKYAQIKGLHTVAHSNHLGTLATLQDWTGPVSKPSLRCGSSKYALGPLSFELDAKGLMGEGVPKSDAFA